MSDRAARLVERLPAIEADAIVVTNLVNLRYLTGYTGSNGVAVIGPETRAFLTDFRYQEQSAAEVDPSFDRRILTLDLLAGVPELLPPGAERLAIEDGNMTVRAHDHLRELLPDMVTLVPAGDAVEALRAVKEPGEIERIRAASQVADAGFRQILAEGLVGRTEAAVADSLEHAMRAHGATGLSFPSIVAAGPHGALPHAQPRDVEISSGELVVIDWGAVLDGYCSDCTRTLATGGLDDESHAVYELVLKAQLAGLQAVRVGVSGRDADGAARAVIDAGGHAEHFGHGLGHGVGMEVHEAPRLSQRSDSVLARGNMVTVEPGVYLPGRLGVRIEDLVVVTDSGCEILTGVPKELINVE
ncbi:MAG TPA: Xaa-Pro peptidase family protein [Solirubrobacteraceae bacterium]|jgi:Xaa-Pro aminopeptidase|nr:Xaa-Pro peptidase family protein [Solirubrobacteraceae bacterium]